MAGRNLDADDLDCEAIDAARLRLPSDKLVDGLRLFDRTCAIMVAGIENERPGIDRKETLRILRERLRLARTLELP